MPHLIGLLIPLIGTMMGSAFVFLMRDEMPVRLQKALLGFALGVMVAASVWSLFRGIRDHVPAVLGIMVLWEQDQQPVNDIAKRLLLETNTVTPLLQRMEKAGLVTRVKGKIDTRQRIVCLTDADKALEEKAKDIPTRLGEKVVQHVPVSELTAIIPALDKLIEGLNEGQRS